MMQWTDAIGKAHCRHPAAQGAPRIVSLVPSLTELLFELGLGASVVGRTSFCVHPQAALASVPRVGGTKGFSRDRIRSLAPTHVLVNIDENRREEVEALAECVPAIIVTHPLGPDDNPPLYRLLGSIFGCEAAAEALCADYARARAELVAAAAAWPREEVLYLIWKDPWMSVAPDTYIARMLGLAGWLTWPDWQNNAAARYPVVDLSSVPPSVVRLLLPSEPYHFSADDARTLAANPVVAGRAVHAIDGEMVSWYGSRAIAALRYLRAFREGLTQIKGL